MHSQVSKCYLLIRRVHRNQIPQKHHKVTLKLRQHFLKTIFLIIHLLHIFEVLCVYIYIVGSQIVAHTLIETGNGPNKPNTINLWESGLKNWANSHFYNSYWGLGTWPRRLKHINKLRFYVRGMRFGQFLWVLIKSEGYDLR